MLSLANALDTVESLLFEDPPTSLQALNLMGIMQIDIYQLSKVV